MNFNKEKIENWYEAIPLGNGNIGGLLFGDSRLVKLSVDCSSLWDLRQSENLSDDKFKFSELLRLAGEGEGSNPELQGLFGDFYRTRPYPTKIPSGSFEFRLPEGEKTEFFFSMKEAVGGVRLSGNAAIESFFSATTFLGYIRCPSSVSFSFVAPRYQANVGEIGADELASLGYPEGSVTVTENSIIYRQPTAGNSYSVIAKYKQCGGYTDIVFAVRSLLDNRSESDIICEIDAALSRGYDKDLSEHKKWWKKYFSKVSVTLPKEYKHIEELYTFAHYLLGAGSRKVYHPMPLQGVWTAADGKLPPWKGGLPL